MTDDERRQVIAMVERFMLASMEGRREVTDVLMAPDIDAILMPDTAVAAFALIEPLEEKLKKPFLTANQVTVWDALRLAGWREPVPGYGRLFHSFRSA